MLKSLAGRLTRLEASRRTGRTITIVAHVDADADADRQLAEIAEATGEPFSDQDCIVVIRRFSPATSAASHG